MKYVMGPKGDRVHYADENDRGITIALCRAKTGSVSTQRVLNKLPEGVEMCRSCVARVEQTSHFGRLFPRGKPE